MSASTFKAEIALDGRAVNRRQSLIFSETKAGSHPSNPFQAGIGATVIVSVGGTVSSVSARMIYMLDGTEQSSQRIVFSSLYGGSQWKVEGSIGGPALGFPLGLDYDEPKPFDLEVTVIYRGGESVKRYSFWVGSGKHQLGETCRTRQGFYALFKNCCLNGVGFRSTVNSPLYPYGLFDAYFDPGTYPAWATGIATGGETISMICAPERELLNPYIPDSISGGSVGNADNPFVTPSHPPTSQSVPYDMLSGAERLLAQVDGSAAEIEVSAGAALPPNDEADAAYASPPGWERCAPLRMPVPVRPSSNVTNRLRAFIGVQWVGGTSAVEASASLTPAATLQISLSGFDPGELVYLFVSTVRPEFIGPAFGVATPPLGVDPAWPTLALEEPRTLAGSGGPAAGLSKLLMGIGMTTGGSSSTYLAARSLTGTAVWGIGAVGGVANLGSGTSLSVVLPVDWTYLAGALALYGAQVDVPDSVMPLFVQGIVLRPGTTLSAAGGGNFGVVWPHSAFLTNVATVRVAA